MERITILPIGLAFDDKLALHSRVAVRVGQPIDVDRWLAARPERTGTDIDESDRASVDNLTEVILDRLVEQILPDRARLVAAVRATTTVPEMVVPRTAATAAKSSDATA